ncbi:hypothetical protein A2348_02850 [Candidatus Uhrbacteria bacterium RIFOXYB12_FULL_58_10]|uniref:Uncharacterized protein n=1 Tax=Candidatus Uhrbacteria bacterium RIFOXYB2_FULL_57_15 TaxID=1802422 RepID=A0A1F7W6L9_9BACT|nr:MAG: hypothetical protein A2348_02850 [Candidatus Uhrbacteria bacterium RIFOXYB12_FULL_58_10]OGL98451.1 MAG: hypothetical protein A2304_02040 [Candidatus Uhrbacteria bacterium RIFOXYB2_FULL_57_15]OGL99234.1 MAG: hypothetical protein A2501_03495 [Candidatus Uhrbacteria bacterium RIFOXYC12_FULL_57_11]
MHPDPFLPLPRFLEDVLPKLTGNASSLAHLVASYRPIGIARVTDSEEIRATSNLTTIALSGINPVLAARDLPDLLRTWVEPDVSLIATLYAGPRAFMEMLALMNAVQLERPDAQFVILTCGCVDHAERQSLLRGIERGTITNLVRTTCGGSVEIAAILDAVIEDRQRMRHRAAKAPAESSHLCV